MQDRTNTDRREHAHRQSSDRRATGPVPRLIDRDVALDTVALAATLGADALAILASERIRVAAEFANG